MRERFYMVISLAILLIVIAINMKLALIGFVLFDGIVCLSAVRVSARGTRVLEDYYNSFL